MLSSSLRTPRCCLNQVSGILRMGTGNFSNAKLYRNFNRNPRSSTGAEGPWPPLVTLLISDIHGNSAVGET